MKKAILLLCICLLLILVACGNDMGANSGIKPTLIISTPEPTDLIDVSPSPTAVPTDKNDVGDSSGDATTFPYYTETPSAETSAPVTEAPTVESTGDKTAEPTGEPTIEPTATVLPTQTPVAPHDCVYGEWIVTVNPTVEHAGVKERECSVCGGKQTEEIPAVTLSDAEKLAEARKVAEGIASSILMGGTDLYRVSEAVQIINNYCMSCVFTFEGTDHSTAYGVLVKGEYSSAGAAEALGLVLEYMGFKWERADGGNAAYHQWCVVKMDGQVGYADAHMCVAGYGSHP